MDEENFLNINECKTCGLYVTSEELYLNSCFYCEHEEGKERFNNYIEHLTSDVGELEENGEWFNC